MGDTERENRKVRASISNAIHHLETIESSLEPFDAGKNREARQRLEDALDTLRERSDNTATDNGGGAGE